MVSRRLTSLAVDNHLVHQRQGGFLPKHCAVDLVAAACSKIEEQKALGLWSAVLSMDVEGAYNALVAGRVYTRLLDHGFPTLACRLVRSWMTGRTSALWDGVQRPVTSGVPQGSLFPPLCLRCL